MTPRKRWAIASWTAFAGWLGLLAWISSRPVPKNLTLPIPHFDKILHFGFFFLGAALLALSLAHSLRRVGLPTALAGWLLIVSAGVFDEIRQLFTPGRSGGDPFDLLADASGAALGLAIVLLIHGRIQRASSASQTSPAADTAGTG